MKCEVVKKMFPDYLMMETDRESSAKIKDHIAECEECRNELETSGVMWTKLEVLPVEFPGQNLKKNFYEMLDSEIKKEKEAAAKKGKLEGILDRYFFHKRLLSPAAIFLMVISGFLMGIFVTSGKLPTGGGIQEAVNRRDPVQVMSSDQSGMIKILNAYEDLRTGSWTESGTLHKKKDPLEMNMFEFFTEAAFNFTEYFEKIITL